MLYPTAKYTFALRLWGDYSDPFVKMPGGDADETPTLNKFPWFIGQKEKGNWLPVQSIRCKTVTFHEEQVCAAVQMQSVGELLQESGAVQNVKRALPLP